MEIDIVMATNLVHTRDRLGIPNKARGRLLNHGPGSSVRGSNLSLDTISNITDISLPSVDDCEGVVIGGHENVAAREAWAEFENTVKSIDNTSYGYLTKKPKPNLVSSNTFQQTMIDIYGNLEYGVSPEDESLGETAVKISLDADRPDSVLSGQITKEENECGASTDENTEVENNNMPVTVPELSAKTYIYNTNNVLRDGNMFNSQMSNSSQTHTLNWTVLRKRLQSMTDPEQARLDLYRRYGLLPTTFPDGQTRCENMMLSERARKITYGRTENGHDNHRPRSYHPPTTHLRSATSFEKHRTENLSQLPEVHKEYRNRGLSSGVRNGADNLARPASLKPTVRLRPHSSYQILVQNTSQSATRSHLNQQYRRPVTAK